MSKITELCPGERCWLEIPNVCKGKTETVVPAHSPDYYMMHGKGAGLKANDIFTVPACVDCHDFIDGRTNSYLDIMNQEPDRQYFFDKGHSAWLIHNFNGGKIKVK